MTRTRVLCFALAACQGSGKDSSLEAMLRGLVVDTEAPSGARVRAATALMDRAGLTPAYAVAVRNKEDQAQ